MTTQSTDAMRPVATANMRCLRALERLIEEASKVRMTGRDGIPLAAAIMEGRESVANLDRTIDAARSEEKP